MYARGKISYIFPQLLIALSLNVCLHTHMRYASGSRLRALRDVSLKPSGATEILICGASSKKMITLNNLLLV